MTASFDTCKGKFVFTSGRCSLSALFEPHLFQLHNGSETTVAVDFSWAEVRQTVCAALGRYRLALNQISWKESDALVFLTSLSLSLSPPLSLSHSLFNFPKHTAPTECWRLGRALGKLNQIIRASNNNKWNTVCFLLHSTSLPSSLFISYPTHTHTLEWFLFMSA